MASYNFPTLNLSSALNAKAALVDSNTPALELNLLSRTGLSFDFTGATWDSAGLFPLYDSSLEGSLFGKKGANQYFDNELYITGKQYYSLQSINSPTLPVGLNGSNKAFFAGGKVPGSPDVSTNIESFSFANDTSVSTYGSLTDGVYASPGASSGENSYTIQGRKSGATYIDAIQKWSNTSGAPVTSTPIAVTGSYYYHSSQPTKIYGQVFFGGSNSNPPFSPWQYLNYSNDTVVDTGFTYPGAPAPAPGRVQGFEVENTSLEFGYALGGTGWKIPFANHIPVVTAGPAPFPSVFLPVSASIPPTSFGNRSIGLSDTISGHGYQAGGGSGAPTAVTAINRFPFSTEVLETNIGNLTVGVYGNTSGSQGETHGYIAYGYIGLASTIEKFPFASSTSGTDIGDPPTGPNTDWRYSSGTEY